MNTQPDQAAALEDKPLPQLVCCSKCKLDFLSRAGEDICNSCRWVVDQYADLANRYAQGRLS